MWWLYFILGLITGWLIISKDFWQFIFRLLAALIVGKRAEIPEELPDDDEEEPAQITQLVKPITNDLSQMPREELAELLGNSEVRVVK